jgi:hypothetical protein
MFRRSVKPLATFTWLAGAVVGVACSIPDYDARETPQSGGEGGENVGGVSGSTSGGGTSAGNGTMGGSAGDSTRGGTAGDAGGSSGGSGMGGGGDGGDGGSTGGDAGSGAAGKGGAGSGGAAGKGGAGSGGAAGKGGAGNGGAGNTGGAGGGGAGNTGGAGSGGAAGKGGAGSGGTGAGGAGSGGAAGKGGAGNGGAGSGGGAGKGGAGSGGAGNGGGGAGGSGPRCFTPNSNNLVTNPGFDTSSISHFISLDSFITHSRSTLDATNCASSGSLAVTNSAPNGLNTSSVYCITPITPGETYNVGGWMMEPSGYAVGQVFLQFLFTDGPDCSGNFVGETVSLQGPSVPDTWESARRDGWVTPIGAVSLGVHVKAIKNFPDTLPYRAHFDLLYVTPVPGTF